MLTIADRIKAVRKAVGLTQQKFADRLGLKQNTIATYEMGRNTPIDAVFTSICREFNVNKHWLETGEGEMFLQMSRTEQLSRAFGELMMISTKDDPTEAERLKLQLISFLAQLDADSWEILSKIAAQWNAQNEKNGE